MRNLLESPPLLPAVDASEFTSANVANTEGLTSGVQPNPDLDNTPLLGLKRRQPLDDSDDG